MKFLRYIFQGLCILITGGKYGPYVQKPARRGYYFSKHWRQKRKEAFAIHGYRCAVCGSTRNLTVHHLRYKRNGKSILYNEDASSDLRILCKKHHPRGYYSAKQIKRDQKSHKWIGWLIR